MKKAKELTFQSLASEALYERFTNMLRYEDGTLSGKDIEDLHQMRVYSRRLVAAINAFRKCFKIKEYQSMLEKVKQITDTLGEVRDLDVQIDFLNKYLKKIPNNEKEGINALIISRKRLRVSRRSRMKLALKKLLTKDLIKSMLITISNPNKKKAIRLQDGILESLNESWNIAKKRHAKIKNKKGFSLLRLHKYRISLKKLRYRMEIFEPYFNKTFSTLLKRVRKMQVVLGNVQDSRVWLEILEKKRNRCNPKQKIGIEAMINKKQQDIKKLLKEFKVLNSKFRFQGKNTDLSKLFK